MCEPWRRSEKINVPEAGQKEVGAGSGVEESSSADEAEEETGYDGRPEGWLTLEKASFRSRGSPTLSSSFLPRRNYFFPSSYPYFAPHFHSLTTLFYLSFSFSLSLSLFLSFPYPCHSLTGFNPTFDPPFNRVTFTVSFQSRAHSRGALEAS